MTIDQAKELMRISRTIKSNIKVNLQQGGRPVAVVIGKIKHVPERAMWTVDSSSAAIGIFLTDNVTIEKNEDQYEVYVNLTGKRFSYDRTMKHVHVIDAIRKISQETNHEQC